jgi:uncharacterized protein YdaU (DUF1376 family)
MHYYQFNIGDYASHTRHLTLIEDLAYRRLLDAYYLQERPLNAGLTSVARQINMREYEAEVKAVLEEFFELTEDGWVSRRADREIQHYKAKREQASKAGKASAERRSNARSTDVQPTNNQEPITKDKTPKPPKGGSQAIALKTYLQNCKELGKKAIPEDDPIFEYAEKAGIPSEFLKLHWLEFKARYSVPDAKKYKSWPLAFNKSVRGNWFKLWYATDNGYALTTTGQQAEKVHKEAA